MERAVVEVLDAREGAANATLAAPTLPQDATPGPSPANELPAVLTVEELAAYLRVNHKTVREAIARGEIPGVCRLGNTIRIHTATVLAWLASGQTRVSRKRYR
jgi:excisionase family DNA binding protein